jgi:hypothetical protein
MFYIVQDGKSPAHSDAQTFVALVGPTGEIIPIQLPIRASEISKALGEPEIHRELIWP